MYNPNSVFQQQAMKIFATKVLARAFISDPVENGNEFIVSIHEGSTRDYAYFVSTANKGAPQSEWKFLWSASAGNRGKGIGFWEYANATCLRRNGNKPIMVKSTYYVKVKVVLELADKLAREWSLHAPSTAKKRTWKTSNWQNDNSQIPPDPDHVLVYADLCKECNQVHRIAHYPSGKIECHTDKLKKNPALYYKYHRGGVFYWGFHVDKFL